MITGPITTLPIPIRTLLPKITSPAPLLIVVKSSMVHFWPISNRFHGNTSMRDLFQRIILPLPFLCTNGLKKSLTQRRGLGLSGGLYEL